MLHLIQFHVEDNILIGINELGPPIHLYYRRHSILIFLMLSIFIYWELFNLHIDYLWVRNLHLPWFWPVDMTRMVNHYIIQVNFNSPVSTE